MTDRSQPRHSQEDKRKRLLEDDVVQRNQASLLDQLNLDEETRRGVADGAIGNEQLQSILKAQFRGPIPMDAAGWEDRLAGSSLLGELPEVSPMQRVESARTAHTMTTESEVQRKTDGDSDDPSDWVQTVAGRGVAGSGGAYPYQEHIQEAFGRHDISMVRAHTGGAASEAAGMIQAKAYATGNDVAFGGSTDLHTAAHEAAHIVQQRAGVSLKGGVGQAGDPYEQHADAVADLVVQGKSAEGLLNTMAGSGKSSAVQSKAVQKDEGATTTTTATATRPQEAPKRTVAVPSVRPVARIKDGVLRNNAINQSYHAFDSAMTQYLGPPLVSNWFTYGQHASREAGEQIKNLQAGIQTLKDVLSILQALSRSTNPWTIYTQALKANRAIKRVIYILDQPGMVSQMVQLLLTKAGVGPKQLRSISQKVDAAGTLDYADFLIPGKQIYEVVRASSALVGLGIDLASAIPSIIVALFKIYGNLKQGNREIYENVAPAVAKFLRATNASADGVVGGMTFAGDTNGYLAAAFELYSEVRKLSNDLAALGAGDAQYSGIVEKRNALAHKANLLIGYQEQLVILQPIFETMQQELQAMGGTMVIRDPNGTHPLIADWGDFYTRMGIDPSRAPNNPNDIKGDGALPPLKDKRSGKYKGTIADYFEGGLTDKKIHQAPSKIAPQRKAASPGAPSGDWVQSVAAQGVAGAGGAYPFQSRIQDSFGSHDISGIRAHTGGAAAEAAGMIQAQAYATGSDVAFKGSPDLHTAAHEAAHMIQQRAGVSLKGGVGQAGDRYEQHADAVADLVVQGKSAEGLLNTMAGSGKSTAVQSKTVQLVTHPATDTVIDGLSRGDEGPEVEELQTLLGFNNVDGSFGPRTELAVKLYQGAHGLTENGIADELTLQSLQREGRGEGANDILFEQVGAGASRSTARPNNRQSGPQGSIDMAQYDENRVLQYKSIFIAIGNEVGVPAALLAAIASRETRAGLQLNDQGYSIYTGNEGFGMMQVDAGHHSPVGEATSEEHVRQAAEILADFRDYLAGQHPDWSRGQCLKAAVAAYNTGPGRVRSVAGMDRSTTGKDYSADTWVRAQYYARHFPGGLGLEIASGEGTDTQLKSTTATARADDQVQSVAAEGVAGSGKKLPHLDKIQESFGQHDVTAVQAHTGSAAGDAAKQIGATAYATGNDVAFGASTDLHTAAHEAAHVVQQRAGVSLKGGVGQAGDRYEQHADAVADLVVQGKSAEGLLNTMARSGKSTAVQSKAVQREESTTSPPPKAVGYFGLNPGADKEFKELKRSAGKRKVVGEVGDYKKQQEFENMKGSDFRAWVAKFIKDTLKITNQEQAKHVSQLLLRECDLALVDELRGLLKMFAGANRGEYSLERIVFSGHHGAGRGVWGHKEIGEGQYIQYGELEFGRDMRLVVNAFPKAASQVQDVMISSCFSVDLIPKLQRVFPNLLSVWAYDNFSPTAKQGSSRHIRKWEQNTRGNKTPSSGAGASAIWVKGQESEKKGTLSDFQLLKMQVDSWEAEHFVQYWEGDLEPTSSGPLRAFYADVQKLKFHSSFSSLIKVDRESYNDLAEMALALRFYHEKRTTFAKDNAALIKTVSEQLTANKINFALPDFSKITRLELREFAFGEATSNALNTLAVTDGPKLHLAVVDKLWAFE